MAYVVMRGNLQSRRLLAVQVSDALPGADLIREGLRDLACGVESIPSLLVLIGAPRLRRIGFDVPDDTPYFPEDRLYAKLAEEDSDSAHSRYNALIRKLVSFERAAECVKP
jgi:hypothetical protein